jgi:urea transporter
MNFTTQSIDKMAIAISSLCVAHCLIFPVLVMLIPSITGLGLASEAFHLWMIVSVIPTSIYALTLGCKKHSHKSVLIFGLIGLSFLITAITPAANIFTALNEKSLTLLGALFIVIAHVKNFKLCQKSHNCKKC